MRLIVKIVLFSTGVLLFGLPPSESSQQLAIFSLDLNKTDTNTHNTTSNGEKNHKKRGIFTPKVSFDRSPKTSLDLSQSRYKHTGTYLIIADPTLTRLPTPKPTVAPPQVYSPPTAFNQFQHPQVLSPYAPSPPVAPYAPQQGYSPIQQAQQNMEVGYPGRQQSTSTQTGYELRVNHPDSSQSKEGGYDSRQQDTPQSREIEIGKSPFVSSFNIQNDQRSFDIESIFGDNNNVGVNQGKMTQNWGEKSGSYKTQNWAEKDSYLPIDEDVSAHTDSGGGKYNFAEPPGPVPPGPAPPGPQFQNWDNSAPQQSFRSNMNTNQHQQHFRSDNDNFNQHSNWNRGGFVPSGGSDFRGNHHQQSDESRNERGGDNYGEYPQSNFGVAQFGFQGREGPPPDIGARFNDNHNWNDNADRSQDNFDHGSKQVFENDPNSYSSNSLQGSESNYANSISQSQGYGNSYFGQKLNAQPKSQNDALVSTDDMRVYSVHQVRPSQQNSPSPSSNRQGRTDSKVNKNNRLVVNQKDKQPSGPYKSSSQNVSGFARFNLNGPYGSHSVNNGMATYQSGMASYQSQRYSPNEISVSGNKKMYAVPIKTITKVVAVPIQVPGIALKKIQIPLIPVVTHHGYMMTPNSNNNNNYNNNNNMNYNNNNNLNFNNRAKA